MSRLAKVLVTGGSGFIGTNLIGFLLGEGYEIINVDANQPRNIEHIPIWRKCDVLDYDSLINLFGTYLPNIVVHLAAHTDLKGTNASAYADNLNGVQNIVSACNATKSVDRLIFTSSLLVCKLGYIPVSDEDFQPDTPYGESKVTGEKIIRSSSSGDYTWTILRPTSIWGPWFSSPYKDFFELVVAGRYRHPNGVNPRRTYGYVTNTVNQIYSIFYDDFASGKVFYLGDQPVTVLQWATEIRRALGATDPKSLPYFLVLIAATFGSMVERVARFPISLRRLDNMSKDAIYDVSYVQEQVEKRSLNNVSFEAAIARTLSWLQSGEGR